jgi:very-short-patch-repair endonuclease
MTTKKLTTEEFIQRCNILHNNIYDYNLVDYKNNKSKVKIICHTHGVFDQLALTHLSGKGCCLCGINQAKQKTTSNTTDFITKAIVLHNNKFDYSLVKYCSAHGKVDIICPLHGHFKQTAGNHLKGHGCPNCTYNNGNIEDFIKKANSIHNNKYSYDKAIYKQNKTKLIITCPKHGDFNQTPDKHLNRNYGCPICKESKGERRVRVFLETNLINFKSQQTFSDCRLIDELPFDFYLPEYKTCIEYHGVQHYEPVKFFGGINKFKEQQKRDRQKEKYCKKQGINLIKIKYTQTVETVLTNFINQQQFINPI